MGNKEERKDKKQTFRFFSLSIPFSGMVSQAMLGSLSKGM